MPRFPARHAATLLLSAAVSCAHPSLFGGDVYNHPSTLVGTWVDSLKSTPTDSSFWILSDGGDDSARRVRRVARDSSARMERRHYGYWYVQGAMNDSLGRALCFTNRPGRSAPTCVPFHLDSLPVGNAFARRLVVYGYQGRHTNATRVLLQVPER